MSKPYKEYKVNELKDLLKERGLAASGTKSELINRLEEADASAASEAKPEPASDAQPEEPAAEADQEAPVAPEPTAEPTDAPASSEPAVTANEVSDSTTAGAAEPATEEPVLDQAPQLTDEELLARFKSDVSAKIERTKRFGGDATELEARLRRIEKFGIAAVRDAAAKAKSSVSEHRHGNRRRNKNRKRSGPKPAAA